MNINNTLVKQIFPVLKIIILCFALLLYILPIGWMYLSSMRTTGEILMDPLGLPSKISFQNYIEAYKIADLGSHFLISVLITGLSVLFIIVLSTLAAFAFSRLRFRGQKILYAVFALGLILPIQSFLVGLFIMFRGTGILNTIWAVILPVTAMGLPLGIYLTKNYFDSLPSSLEESALVEGASTLQIFWMIILPLSTPITATVITFSAIGAWNEFMLPFVMIQDSSIKPLTTSLYVFSTKYSANISLKLAALTMIATPMFFIYFLFQRQITKGLTAGAIKN
jgi:raffinose/stachyose/melibiose transport system permease protein